MKRSTNSLIWYYLHPIEFGLFANKEGFTFYRCKNTCREKPLHKSERGEKMSARCNSQLGTREL